MQTMTVCVLNSKELAADLGKKGTESDITLYNHKKGDRSLTAVVPTRFPEKLPPLLFSLYLGDKVYMVIDKLDRTIGEQMVACEVVGKKEGTIFLTNYIQPDQIAPLTKDTVIEGWEVVDGLGNANELREHLLSIDPEPRPGPTKINVDHSFPVKGVGTVCLGLVDRGTVTKHQKLDVLPSKKVTQVRSIQVHDNDVDETSTGSRVGLALKNIEVDDVPRGSVLAEQGSLEVAESMDLQLKVNKFFSDTVEDSMVVHVVNGMQFVPAQISTDTPLKGGEEGKITLKLESPLAMDPEDRPVVVWLEATGPRIVGSGRPL